MKEQILAKLDSLGLVLGLALSDINELTALAEQIPDEAPSLNYQHLLDPVTGKQPSFVDAIGRRWSTATASEITPGMPHCCQVDEAKDCLRFELRVGDKSSDGRPRAEISTVETQEHQAHNGETVWNSWLFRMSKWPDPAAMAKELGSSAMSISQLKPNSGGSPTRCHRLTGEARFQATKVANGGSNVTLYTSPSGKRYDDGLPHRILERITPHPTSGRWELWLDGAKVVNFTGAIGANTDGYSPSFGIYSSGGIGCDLSIEYAVEGLLSKDPLIYLMDAPLKWPA